MARYLRSIISDRFISIPFVQTGNYVLNRQVNFFKTVNDYIPNELDRSSPWLICDWTPNIKGHPTNIPIFPLKDRPTLHREFADLKKDAEIVKFANSHGFIGFPMLFKKRGRNGDKLVIGESLKRWLYETRRIRSLLGLWDSAGTDKHVDYNEAYQHICKEINTQLKQYVYPQILPKYDGNIYLWVPTLLSSFYVMFAWEISGDNIQKYCPSCHTWFKPKSRRDAKTCSISCRKRLSRSKKRLMSITK